MRLPPLNALRAFEAAARHGGFIGAADELCVTRGAVSRHVKLLEEHLGTPLFRRLARGVELTDAGRRLLPVLTEAFRQIAEASERLTAEAGDLQIICPPATSIRWLIPRLEAFRAAHPEIRLRLTTDFHGDGGYDVSAFDIGFSVVNWPSRPPGVSVRPLFPVLLTPLCAPALLEGPAALRRPEDIARFKLLHETRGHDDWRAWHATFPVEGLDVGAGDVFPNLDLAARAATMGAGIVMGDLMLCRDELNSGLLIAPFPEMVCNSPYGDICLIARDDRWTQPKVQVFADWMQVLAARETVAMGL